MPAVCYIMCIPEVRHSYYIVKNYLCVWQVSSCYWVNKMRFHQLLGTEETMNCSNSFVFLLTILDRINIFLVPRFVYLLVKHDNLCEVRKHWVNVQALHREISNSLQQWLSLSFHILDDFPDTTVLLNCLLDCLDWVHLTMTEMNEGQYVWQSHSEHLAWTIKLYFFYLGHVKKSQYP